MELRFPQPPAGWVPNDTHFGANIGDPTINDADFGVGALAVCNDDVVRPLWVCSSNIGYHLLLRFGPPNSSQMDLAGDLYRRMARRPKTRPR